MESFYKMQNSRFFTLLTKFSNLIILSALWALFTVPVITAGAAKTALYYGVHKCMRRRSDSPVRDFMKSFRANLQQGCILSVIYLAYMAFSLFDIYFAKNGLNGFRLPDWYELIAYLLLLPLAFTYPFVFPCLSRFGNTIKNTLKNSFTFCSMHFLHTVLLLVIEGVCIAVIVVCPPLALIVPAIGCAAGMPMIEKDFRIAMKLDEDEYERRFGSADEDEGEDGGKDGCHDA